MPPVVSMGAVAGVATGLTTFDFATPARTKVGDTMIAVVVGDETNTYALVAGSSWSAIAASTGILIARRIVTATDGPSPPSLVLAVGVPTTWALAAMIVYRGLAPNVAVVDAYTRTAIAASSNFVCPSKIAARYSDIYLGLVVVTSAAVAVTAPSRERVDINSGGHTLEIFDQLPEATGATGTRTATTAAPQSGWAGSIMLASDGVRGWGKAIKINPPGALGLPTEGV